MLRVTVDFCPPALIQATLCDFMTEGHLGRHIRKSKCWGYTVLLSNGNVSTVL